MSVLDVRTNREYQDSRVCDQRAFPGSNSRGQSNRKHAYKVRIQKSWIFFPERISFSELLFKDIPAWDSYSKSWPSRVLTWSLSVLSASIFCHTVEPVSPGLEWADFICLNTR